MKIAPVVILAGGRGTRLQSVTNGSVPKIMVPLLGRPFIDFKLKQLANAGVTQVILLLGVGGELVEEHVMKEPQGLQITCIHDGEILKGTGGAIKSALDVLPNEFWVTYGDNLVTTDFIKAQLFLESEKTEGLMCVMENNNLFDKSNLSVNSGKVTSYSKLSQDNSYSWIDYGLIYLKKKSFKNLKFKSSFDLSEVISVLIASEMLSAWKVSQRFWEIGTPESLAETENYLKTLSIQ
jgi:NDP-sugar pyrophosphorylase family protein